MKIKRQLYSQAKSGESRANCDSYNLAETITVTVEIARLMQSVNAIRRLANVIPSVFPSLIRVETDTALTSDTRHRELMRRPANGTVNFCRCLSQVTRGHVVPRRITEPSRCRTAVIAVKRGRRETYPAYVFSFFFYRATRPKLQRRFVRG